MKRIILLIIFSYASLQGQDNIDLQTAQKYYEEGKDAYYKGKYKKAMTLLDSALVKGYSAVESPHNFLLRAEQRMGNTARKARNYNKAERHLMMALDHGISLHGEKSERAAGVMNDLAIVFEKQGLYTKAIQMYDDAISIKKDIFGEDSKEAAHTQMNKAQIYYDKGNFSKCLAENYAVLSIYNKTLKADDENYNRVYLAMSNAFRKKGDLENSLKFAKSSLEVKLKNYNAEHPSVAKYYDNVGKVLVSLGRYDEAKIYFNKSIKIVEATGDLGRLGSSINDAARVYMVSGDVELAYNEFEKVVSLLSVNKVMDSKIHSAKYNMATCLYAMGKKTEGYQLLKDQIENFDDSEIYLKLSEWSRDLGDFDEAKAYAQIGRVKISDGDDLAIIEYLVNDSKIIASENVENAWGLVNEAIELLIKLRRTYTGDYSKKFINEELENIFEWAVILGKKRWEEESTLASLEDLFHIIEKAKAASFWDDLSEENAYYYGGVPSDLLEHIEILKEEGISSKAELESQMELLRKEYPEYFLRKYSLDVPPLSLVQASLKEGMVVLDYFVLEDEVIAVYISQDEVKLVSQINSGSISFDEELKNISSDIERISIVPHKFIHFVAFDQLIHPETGRYLLYDYAFSYQVNIRGLLEGKSTKNANDYLGFVPTWGTSSAATTYVTRSALVPLPGAIREINAVAKLFTGKVFDENEASESAFYRDAPKFDLLHFATHAEVDPTNELNSVLYLHSESEKEDGILEMDEIMDTRLNASLVILSACETGAGGLQSGEGVMSLARAFQYAGARSVLMSLWRANDKSAHPIILNFIENYRNGMDKDVALQVSKLNFLEHADPLLRDQFYWAGFMISGDLNAYEGGLLRYKYFFFILGLLLLFFLLYRFA